MNTFVLCCLFSVLLRMGLSVQLVCDIIMYLRYYNVLSVLLSPIFPKMMALISYERDRTASDS